MVLVWILLAIPCVLAIGYAGESLGMFTPGRRRVTNAFAYYVALPALLFVSTAERNFGELVSFALVGGVLVTFGGTMAIAWIVHGPAFEPPTRSVAIVQSYPTNFGYLGIPLVAIIFGELATARGALVLGLGAIVQVSATIAILSRLNGAGSRITDAGRILVNPILLALAVGMIAAHLELPVPTSAMTGLGYLGDLALPLALLVTGASLNLGAGDVDTRLTGRVIGLKVLCMPVRVPDLLHAQCRRPDDPCGRVDVRDADGRQHARLRERTRG